MVIVHPSSLKQRSHLSGRCTNCIDVMHIVSHWLAIGRVRALRSHTGIHVAHRSAGEMPSQSLAEVRPASRRERLMRTPLGTPVDPDVNWTMAGASESV